MKKYLLAFLSVYVLSLSGSNAYFVSFKDKDEGSTFDPHAYFDKKAIQNKTAMGLPLFDWYDLPVKSNYLSEVASRVDSVGYTLRWFNGITIYASDHQISSVF